MTLHAIRIQADSVVKEDVKEDGTTGSRSVGVCCLVKQPRYIFIYTAFVSLLYA